MGFRRFFAPALLLVALIALALYATREEPKPPEPAAPARAPESRAGAPPSNPFNWRTGQRRTYTLSSVRTVRFRSEAAGTTAPAPTTEEIRLALSGRWSVTVLRADALAVLAEVQLGALQVDFGAGGSGADPAQLERLRADLTAPFFLMMEPSGRLRALRLRRGSDPASRGLLKAVAASLQYARAPGPSGATPSWTHDEVDATGEYQARYQLGVDGTRCDKSRVRYTRVAAVQGLLPVESLGGTSGELRLAFTLARTDDESARVEALSGTDTLTVDAGPGMPRIVTESQVSLRLLETAPAGDLLAQVQLAEGPDYEAALLGISDPDPDSTRRADERLVQGARFEDLLALLRGLPAGDDGQARAAAMTRLSALVRLEPQAARKAQQVVAQGAPVAVGRTLVGALGGAGSPAAQEALVQIGESAAVPADVRLNALAALGLTEQPTDTTSEALSRLSSDPDIDVRSTAALALANAALSQRRNGQTGEAEQSVDQFLERLQAAQTEDEQLLYLQALGNAGDPRSLPALQAALRAPRASLRKAAAQALRFIPSDGSGANVDQLLTEVLLGDAAPDVRLGALFGISFRPLLVFLPALQRAVLADADEGVRIQTVNLLGKALGSTGPSAALTILPLLKQVADKDTSVQVRQAALALLKPPAR